jgi:hypothetical protein
MSTATSTRAPATTAPAVASVHDAAPAEHQLTRLVLTLIRPYAAWLAIVLVAMVVEIAMSLSADAYGSKGPTHGHSLSSSSH